ncbi:phosphatidic acid phosphatase type 2/haloperoxidase [Lipomyces kononenkoae]
MTVLRKTADGLERWAPVMHQYYFTDWVFVFLLLGGFMVLTDMTPFQSMFTLDDPSLQHPYATTERVSSKDGVMLSTIIGIGIIVLFVPLLHRKRNWRHVMNVSLLSLALSLILTEFATELLKNFIGRPRPDFIARCLPAPGTPLHELVGIEVCTNPSAKVISDGFRSTPSGHTSNAFAGLGWLSAWIAGQLRVFRHGTELFRTMLALLPFLGALLIALSRIEDYRHHITDIIFGGLLGALIAWYSYRKFFPHLGNATCHIPFPPPDFKEKAVVESDDYESLDEMESGTQKAYSD